jgi:glutathione S-transferase
MLRLYYIPLGCSLASHIALEESGAEFETREMLFERGDTQSPAFLKLNPKAFVPVLETDHGVITENPAILLYIAQSFPDGRLLPSNDAFGCAQVNSFNAFLASAVHITYRQLSRPTLFADGPQAALALKAKVPEMAHKYFGLIENQLGDGRTWIHGERYTVSDPYLFVYSSYLQWGDRGNPDRFPLVRAHRERVLARSAVQRAIEREGTGDPALYFGGDNILGAIDGPDEKSTAQGIPPTSDT